MFMYIADNDIRGAGGASICGCAKSRRAFRLLFPEFVHYVSGLVCADTWSLLRPHWVSFGRILGLFWAHTGSLLGTHWVSFGRILGLVWAYVGAISTTVYLSTTA